MGLSAVELRFNYETIGADARRGHYLDRITLIAKASGFFEEMKLLQAFQVYLNESCKPAGLDEFLFQVARDIIFCGRHVGLSDEDFRPIAWGIPFEVLKEMNLVHIRRSFKTQSNREDV